MYADGGALAAVMAASSLMTLFHAGWTVLAVVTILTVGAALWRMAPRLEG